MRKLRDVFYINAFPENNEFVYYGMEFKEFVKYAPVKLNQLLLIKSEFYGSHFSNNTNFYITGKSDLEDLLNDDVCNYGDFCWVDFNSEENVENLKPTEVAELLYLGHKYEPITSPFFEALNNHYTYLAHDDGWFCRLYCRQYKDFAEIIANKITDMVKTSRNKIHPVSEEVQNQLLKLAEDGLLIDFNNINKYDRTIEIPIYTIGKFINMDKMYNGLKQHIGRAKYSAKLVHKNKNWTIDYIAEK